MILALYTVDCFGYRLAMTRGSVHKNFIVMLSEAKHLFAIPFFVYFVKGDRGATCEAPSLSPLTIPQTPSRFLKVCAPHGLCHVPQRMRQRYAYGSNIAAVRCGWEDRIMSNGESKIAIFKAALCCGFAIALRALFLGILSC